MAPGPAQELHYGGARRRAASGECGQGTRRSLSWRPRGRDQDCCAWQLRRAQRALCLRRDLLPGAVCGTGYGCACVDAENSALAEFQAVPFACRLRLSIHVGDRKSPDSGSCNNQPHRLDLGHSPFLSKGSCLQSTVTSPCANLLFAAIPRPASRSLANTAALAGLECERGSVRQ